MHNLDLTQMADKIMNSNLIAKTRYIICEKNYCLAFKRSFNTRCASQRGKLLGWKYSS